MASIPQELVDAIVGKVADIPSLKACALAGSMFRETSQRTLLQSLRLTTSWKDPDWSATCSLLEESPHIASYITHLTIEVLDDTPSNNIKCLEQILAKLVNVRKCVIDELTGVFDAGYHTPTFPSALLDFLTREPLRELHVVYIDQVSANVVLRMLTTAPIVSFFDVTVPEDLGHDPVPDMPQHPPKVQDLILNENESTHLLLSQPQSKSYTQLLLRRLSFDTRHDPSSRLICAIADTLQYIRFNIYRLEEAIPTPIPLLPMLTVVEFLLGFNILATPSFSDLILDVVRMSPQLAIITIYAAFEELEDELVTNVTQLPVWDAVISAHPVRPTMQWCLTFPFTFWNRSERAEPLAEFAEPIRRGMPNLQEEGRLVFDKYYEHRFEIEQYLRREWPYAGRHLPAHSHESLIRTHVDH
ncbi:hypothetical protein MVEN_00377800 [Mycena venus]|uniref:Uncharacterized protein n=1 Tax=Mycena venus TaxID=2733690 RepID=A0A8H7DAY6_9AGAR|nr:hypothetical protein MVEN_00377800 [Mycena venus]